jgi:hypothetical protein
MTRPTITEALESRDITIALTPTQLALIAIGAFLLLRIVRNLRR